MNETEANYRELPEPETCGNCGNRTHAMSEGYSKCTMIPDHTFEWAGQRRHTCDLWSYVHIPTKREIALSKLTTEERIMLELS